MEYSCVVHKTTNVNFKFKDDIDLEQLAKEFSEYIFAVDVPELIKFISIQIADEPSFIEGIGKIEYSRNLIFDYLEEKDVVLVYNVDVTDVDVE